MDITEEQKEERKEAASDLWWVLLLLFALIETSIEDGNLDYALIYETFVDSYTDVVEKYTKRDEYITQYIPTTTQNILNTTWDNIDLSEPESYWTSSERALGIAVNEANTILNYEDLRRAIEAGMNVKIWKTKKDELVRETHRLVNEVKIGIDKFFKVGNSLLLFPRDAVNCENIREIANCRCQCKAEYDPNFTEANDIGFSTNKVSDISKAEIERYNESNVVQNNAREIYKQRIENKTYSLSQSRQKYQQHIEGTPQYNNAINGRKKAPSRLTISFEEAQDIIKKYSGRGLVSITKSGLIDDKEYVNVDKIIGMSQYKGVWKPTSRVAIHHGKDYSHLVPVNER